MDPVYKVHSLLLYTKIQISLPLIPLSKIIETLR